MTTDVISNQDATAVLVLMYLERDGSDAGTYVIWPGQSHRVRRLTGRRLLMWTGRP